MQRRIGKQTRAARREEWRRVIEAAEASGGSIRGYCQRHGIRPSHYYYWRQRLRGKRESGEAASGEFVLVGTTGTGAGDAAALELVVERGWRLRIGTGVEERVLRAVLAALAAQA